MGPMVDTSDLTLSFPGTRLDGLEVILRCNFYLIERLILIERLGYLLGPANLDTSRLVAEYLVTWNLVTRDGSAVPPTLGSVLNQDIHFAPTVIQRWLRAILDRLRLMAGDNITAYLTVAAGGIHDN